MSNPYLKQQILSATPDELLVSIDSILGNIYDAWIIRIS